MTTEVAGYSRPHEKGLTLSTATATAGVATITLAAATGVTHVLDRLWFSYSAAPATVLALTIAFEDGATFDIDIADKGVGPLDLGRIYGGEGKSVTVSLAAGAAGVVGKLVLASY